MSRVFSSRLFGWPTKSRGEINKHCCIETKKKNTVRRNKFIKEVTIS